MPDAVQSENRHPPVVCRVQGRPNSGMAWHCTPLAVVSRYLEEFIEGGLDCHLVTSHLPDRLAKHAKLYLSVLSAGDDRVLHRSQNCRSAFVRVGVRKTGFGPLSLLVAYFSKFSSWRYPGGSLS